MGYFLWNFLLWDYIFTNHNQNTISRVSGRLKYFANGYSVDYAILLPAHKLVNCRPHLGMVARSVISSAARISTGNKTKPGLLYSTLNTGYVPGMNCPSIGSCSL